MRLPLLTAIGVLLGIGASAASSTTSCGNLPTPSPAGKSKFHCREQGRTQSAEIHTIRTFQSKTGNDDACYQSCLGDATCISFSYNYMKNSCATYKTPINKLSYSGLISSSIYYSNLRGCFLPATCQPAPKQYILNGGFEDAAQDSDGNLSSSGWSFEDAQIQQYAGYRQSKFSLSVLRLVMA